MCILIWIGLGHYRVIKQDGVVRGINIIMVDWPIGVIVQQAIATAAGYKFLQINALNCDIIWSFGLLICR